MVGEVDHELAVPPKGDVVDEVARERAHRRTQRLHRSRRERPAHQLAQPGAILAVDREEGPGEELEDRPVGQALEAHDGQERAVETGIGQQGLHLLVRHDDGTDRGAREAALRAHRVRRRRRVGLELRGEEVQERRVVDGFHAAEYRAAAWTAQGWPRGTRPEADPGCMR